MQPSLQLSLQLSFGSAIELRSRNMTATSEGEDDPMFHPRLRMALCSILATGVLVGVPIKMSMLSYLRKKGPSIKDVSNILRIVLTPLPVNPSNLPY